MLEGLDAMGEVSKITMDSMIVERMKRAAAGMPRDKGGPPVSELDRLMAQGALTARSARPKGGSSLFATVNALLSMAVIDGSMSVTSEWMQRQGESAFFATVMGDIVSGRLIVREPLNFLRCNGLPEIQGLASAKEGFESMAILVRFTVKDDDVRAWLEWHGVTVPDWLHLKPATNPPGKFELEKPAKWSAQLSPGQRKGREQFDAVEDMIQSMGYPPKAIPHGGKAILKKECAAMYPEIFDRLSSFDNCWDALNALVLVRTYNYDAYRGTSSD